MTLITIPPKGQWWKETVIIACLKEKEKNSQTTEGKRPKGGWGLGGGVGVRVGGAALTFLQRPDRVDWEPECRRWSRWEVTQLQHASFHYFLFFLLKDRDSRPAFSNTILELIPRSGCRFIIAFFSPPPPSLCCAAGSICRPSCSLGEDFHLSLRPLHCPLPGVSFLLILHLTINDADPVESPEGFTL